MKTPLESYRSRAGFTLVELTIVAAIFMILASMGTVVYRQSLIIARETVAITEIRQIQDQIQLYAIREGDLPPTLADVYANVPLDPWGRPYYYLKFGKFVGGMRRKDKFIIAINSSFDLYSSGPDGMTDIWLTPMVSWDDIIRANDGDFIGKAIDY